VPGHWYSLSRAPNPRWKGYYAGQPEIRAYWEGIWASRGLRAHTRFGTEVVSATWDAQSQTYAVVLEDVDVVDRPFFFFPFFLLLGGGRVRRGGGSGERARKTPHCDR